MHKWMAVAMVSAGALASVQAQAETLNISGIYAAQVDLPGHVEVIATEPFGGDAGADVELAITDLLGGVTIEGEPYFRFTQANPFSAASSLLGLGRAGNQANLRNPNAPDAVLRGTVHSDVTERRLRPRIVEHCAERDEEGVCIRFVERRIPCRELTMRLDPRLVLVADDGKQLYVQRTPAIESVSYCMNDFVIPSSADMANRLVDEIAARVRFDLAPVYEAQGHRIMESRSGLSKPDRVLFKEGIRLTKTDPAASCDVFESLLDANPEHRSVLFNVGLCTESFGDLPRAQRFYTLTQQIHGDHRYYNRGITRIANRYRADAQLAARAQAQSVRFGLR